MTKAKQTSKVQKKQSTMLKKMEEEAKWLDDTSILEEPHEPKLSQDLIKIDTDTPINESYKTRDRLLAEPVPKEYVSFRPGPGGSQLAYITCDQLVNQMNTLFGEDGWAFEISDQKCVEKGKQFEAEATCILKRYKEGRQGRSGTWYQKAQDMGVCSNRDREVAKKGAISDAVKRACRWCGAACGGSLYNKAEIEQYGIWRREKEREKARQQRQGRKF